MLIPIVQGGVGAIVLDVSANVAEYNILTAATAVGYNAATNSTSIIVNVASGVTVSGSSTHAMRTGALNADTSLTINITGSVSGYTGANGGTGAAGALGASGASGGNGSYGGGSASCNVASPGSGRAGGAAGYALRKNSRTVTVNNSGTVAGTVG